MRLWRRIPSAGSLFQFSEYLCGVTPVDDLKTRMKYEILLKPLEKQASVTEAPLRSNSLARSTRRFVRYRLSVVSI
jgi:hypothetical protein